MVNLFREKLLLAVFMCPALFSWAENHVYVLGEAGKTSLGVDLMGGAFVDFRLSSQAENPFSWSVPSAEMPENNRAGAPFQGHFLCLGRWGAPTDGEIRAGIPHNGQPGNGLWNVAEQSSDSFLHLRSSAPLDGMEAERLIYFDAEHAVVKVTDYVKNTLATGRLFNIVQHATVGAPFLSASTVVDCNAKEGFMQHLSYPNPHAYEYMWPAGVLDSLGTQVDLRRSDTETGYVTTHLFDEDTAWITAASPACGLLIGYVWRAAEYPWLNVWHDVRDGKPYAKGLEFGTTGIGRSYQDLLAIDTRFHGENSFFFLDASESFVKSFVCFQMTIPVDYKGVERVELKDGMIVVTEKGMDAPRTIGVECRFALTHAVLSNPGENGQTGSLIE